MAWHGIIGRSFSQAEFAAYVSTLHWTGWRPQFIVLHNTGAPNLAQRPQGLTLQHIHNLEGYYRDTQHWSAGPHLFIDDKQIWAFSPLTSPGVHSPSWNSISIGIEMLGDYAIDAFDSGRGAAVRDNAVSAIATLSAALGLDPHGMKLHKEDKKTTHDCPGKNVHKDDVISRIIEAIHGAHPGDHPPPLNTGNRTWTVNVQGLNLREQARSDSPIVEVLDKGVVVTIIGEAATGPTKWLHVNIMSGLSAKTGWVAARFVDVSSS